MKYPNIHRAVFLNRPNRFIAHCLLNDKQVIAHVPNTGRCKELFLSGVPAYLVKAQEDAKRKTPYTLVAVEKEGRLINIDSNAPNKVVAEALLSGNLLLPGTKGGFELKREVFFGASRLDFCLYHNGHKSFIEVKGVTLEDGGKVMFPDAPTIRGIRHLEELTRIALAANSLDEAWLIFVVQMEGVKYFSPNWQTHAAFGQALYKAQQQGVGILAYDCHTAPQSLSLGKEVKVVFG